MRALFAVVEFLVNKQLLVIFKNRNSFRILQGLFGFIPKSYWRDITLTRVHVTVNAVTRSVRSKWQDSPNPKLCNCKITN